MRYLDVEVGFHTKRQLKMKPGIRGMRVPAETLYYAYFIRPNLIKKSAGARKKHNKDKKREDPRTGLEFRHFRHAFVGITDVHKFSTEC